MILALLFVSGIIFLSIKDRNDIDKQLVRVDRYIHDGEIDKAAGIVTKLGENISDRYSCYRVIKRAIKIGDILSDYNCFLSVSRESVELYPGNEDIQAYYIKALLKTGDYVLAGTLADKYLISNEFKPLLAETILYNENENRASMSMTQYIASRKEPVFFEYLANLLNDDSLMVNASLLWAKNGEIDKAYRLLSSLNDEYNSELMALLAYDSGRESEALIRLLDLPISDSIKYDNILLTADLFYLRENWSRSRFYYEKALDVDILNAAPYINIASIYLQSDSTKKSLSILENGIEKFDQKVAMLLNEIDSLKQQIGQSDGKEEKKLLKRLLIKKRESLVQVHLGYKELVLLAHYLYKDIESDKAIKVIDNYRRKFPNDIKIELLEMRESDLGTNSSLFIARLWKLLNKDIDNREVSEFMIWYLLGLENYADIELVLERSENRYPEQIWTEYYRGILSGLDGDYKSALKSFQLNNPGIDSWEILYNKGIIEMALSNSSEALTLFNKSIISINQLSYVNNRDIYLSKIKTKIAQVLISLNDIDEAIRVLNSAFELDPDNYSSDLLKSIHLNLQDSE